MVAPFATVESERWSSCNGLQEPTSPQSLPKPRSIGAVLPPTLASSLVLVGGARPIVREQQGRHSSHPRGLPWRPDHLQPGAAIADGVRNDARSQEADCR